MNKQEKKVKCMISSAVKGMRSVPVSSSTACRVDCGGGGGHCCDDDGGGGGSDVIGVTGLREGRVR